MYQMMIIDDEPIVRSGLKELLSWEELGFEICAEGQDGKDGLQKVLEFQPDVVLVDLKMPGLSGIELIREAKKQGFEGTFIILTGYSDFEFAKTAVSLGVRAYLLKPIDEDELLDNIKEVLRELESAKNLEAYYGKNELKAKQEVLRRLLLYLDDKEILRKEIRPYGVDFRYDTFCVAVLDGNTLGFASEPNTEMREEKIECLLHSMERTERVPIEDDKWALIGKGYESAEFEKKLISANEKLNILLGTSFFITIGHNVTNWEDLHFSYESACLLLDYRFLYGDSDVVTLRLLEESGKNERNLSVEQLMQLIELGDVEGLKLLIDDLPLRFRKLLQKEAEIKIRMVRVVTQIQNLILRRYNGKDAEFPDIDLLTEQINNADTLGKLQEYLYTYCLGISNVIGASSSDTIIKRMNAYMENNYDKDLKLEAIAKMFNYNSAYLGKIFKREMGESFNNVLDHIRIENAKRLLNDTDLKVYQVSERVGFSNIDYFYAKFKRYVGVSPKEFKKQV